MPAAFAPVVDAARARITDTFGNARLHSAYLYGSVPRGTAIPGVSDLDLLLALRDAPSGADHAFDEINGVGVELSSAHALLSELERHDGGFFVACLCTPLLGVDLADQLPPVSPDVAARA